LPEPRPSLLAENIGLAFIGEKPWPPAQLTARQAKSFEAARNPSGRPNSDVIRHLVGFDSGHLQETIQVDFPPHFTEQEAALYLKPFSLLRAEPSTVGANLLATPQITGWLNPHAQPDLRTALARLDRYLATPLAAENPSWDWIDSQRPPDATLLVIARDDDFTHGLLQSRVFAAWWHAWARQLSPTEIVEAFPFPWPPVTLLSALTRTQEEHRLAVARSARTGEQDSLDGAVASAYGWPGDLADEELVANLTTLNRQRSR